MTEGPDADTAVPRPDLALTSAQRAMAACRHVDPDVMFPTHTQAALAAVAVCVPCPVREACATDRLANATYTSSRPIGFGVWGGLAETQRIAMVREVRRG